MSKMESRSSSNRTSKGKGAIAFVLSFSLAALAASGVAYADKHKPAPDINDKVCASIGGVWTHHTCTIPAESAGVASFDFNISKESALDVKGSLTINTGVTISNSGTIIVENVTGVTPAEFGDAGLMAGILILGTLDNSGAITIQNAAPNTEGIAVSISVSASAPSDPDPFVVVPGVLTNSGTIAVRNTGQTQGINNLGTLDNSASGTIAIANSLTSSVGIRNKRYGGSSYSVNGTMTNAGRITVANSGDADGRGISNAGSFTNSDHGTFTINPSTVADDAALGFRNNGSFTNFGSLINKRGRLVESDYSNSTGSRNISPGAMMNYGKTYVGTTPVSKGTFYNEFIMINFGEITSYGVLDDTFGMINYGTLYNYGLISGGLNVGICIDEPGSSGGC